MPLWLGFFQFSTFLSVAQFFPPSCLSIRLFCYILFLPIFCSKIVLFPYHPVVSAFTLYLQVGFLSFFLLECLVLSILFNIFLDFLLSPEPSDLFPRVVSFVFIVVLLFSFSHNLFQRSFLCLIIFACFKSNFPFRSCVCVRVFWRIPTFSKTTFTIV